MVLSRTAKGPGQKLIHTRKGTKSKHNGIRTNQANLALPLDSKAASERKMATNRNANANSASGRSKAVVANKVAVSKADDKSGCLELVNGGSCSPPFLFWDLSGLSASQSASF